MFETLEILAKYNKAVARLLKLYQLLKEKGNDGILFGDIIKEARVAPNTFYNDLKCLMELGLVELKYTIGERKKIVKEKESGNGK